MNETHPGQDDYEDETIPTRASIGGADFFTLDGDPFTLPGEGIIFLDFWYSGCYPCLKSAPILEKIYETYKDQDMVLFRQ